MRWNNGNVLHVRAIIAVGIVTKNFQFDGSAIDHRISFIAAGRYLKLKGCQLRISRPFINISI
jgi:hypothetical protein